MATFQSLRVPSHYLSRLARIGIVSPTAPQRAALAMLMPRTPSEVAKPTVSHAVLRWPTGSGKTLAYALPLLSRLDTTDCGGGLQGLVLCPTRELVLQTLHTLQRLVDRGKANRKGHSIKVQALLGQRTRRLEAELAKSPPDVVVGTPHAIGSLQAAGLLRLSPDPRKRTIVLDEIGALCEPYRWPEVRKVLGGGTPGSGATRSPPWAAGGIWLVSADVPAGAAEQCLEAAGVGTSARVDAGSRGPRSVAAGAGGRDAGGRGTLLLEPPASHALRLPRTLRHVALPPLSPVASTLAGLVEWTSLAEAQAAEAAQAAAEPMEVDAMEAAAAGLGTDGEWAAMADESISERQAYVEPSAQTRSLGARGSVSSSGRSSSARALVFVESSGAAEQLRRAMRNRRVSAAAIHSADGQPGGGAADDGAVLGERILADGRRRREQAQLGKAAKHKARAHSLRLFAEGRVRVLVATDMLAYGVDVRGASHVVNAHVPSSAAVYLHRAGRVGRIGGTPGTVLSLPRSQAELDRLRGFAEELGFALEEAPALTTSLKRPLLGVETITDESFGIVASE